MKDLTQYSMLNLLKIYQNNKASIHADIRGETYEGYDDDNAWKLLGMSGVALVIFMLLQIIFWIWALVALIQNYNQMPTWAIVVGILGLVFQFPLVTLLLAYLVKK